MDAVVPAYRGVHARAVQSDCETSRYPRPMSREHFPAETDVHALDALLHCVI